MADEDIRAELARRNRDDLRVIAKRLKLKNYSKTTKDELITLLLQKNNPRKIKKALSITWWGRNSTAVYGWASIVSLLFGVYVFFRPSQPNTNSKNDEVIINQNNPNGNLQLNQPQPPQGTSEITLPSPTSTVPTPTPNMPTATPRTVPSKEAGKQASLYLSRARALYNQGKYQAALIQCNKTLGLEPNNKEALNLRSNIERTIAILKNN